MQCSVNANDLGEFNSSPCIGQLIKRQALNSFNSIQNINSSSD